MAIVIEWIRDELRAEWERKYGKQACEESSKWSIDEWVARGDLHEFACSTAASLTGAEFYDYRFIPTCEDDDQGCAEALIAQWYGLAPVVKMPRKKKAAK